MKNPGKSILDKAINRRLAGEAWHPILESTGLSHSQAERHEFRMKMWLQANGHPVEGDWSPIEPTGSAIKAARVAGTSWGVIGERASISEAKARKLFTETTNVESKGLRIGRGGRYAFNDEALYEPNRQAGIAIPVGHGKPKLDAKGTKVIGISTEQRQALQALGMDTLRKRVDEAKDRNKA